MRRLATFIGLVAFGVIVFALYFSTAAQVTAPFLVSAMQISQRLNPELQFLSWCSAHSKKYQNDEEIAYRFAVFVANQLDIERHNALYDSGMANYKKALNCFSDLTHEEFSSKYLRPLTRSLAISNYENAPPTSNCTGAIMDAPNPPESFDWLAKVATPVMNQGECGRDWAIVAAGAVQGLYALKVGTLVQLSSQQLVDCSGNYRNEGCNGGFMDQAFWYIIDNGIATEKSYPFRADNKTGKCVYVLNMKYTGFGRCASIPSGNYSKLVSAILQQPVSTAIDFSPDMISYSQGVYNGNCTDEINHGMLILGYGIDDTCNGPCNGTAFWKLKNSFGPSWGENGYIRIFKTETDGSGPCGIQLIASVPQLLN